MYFKEINNLKQFDNILKQYSSYILVFYFYTNFCQTSIIQESVLENFIKNMNNNNIIFCKIDIEKAEDLVSYLDITSVPIIYFYKNSKKTDECFGTYVELIDILKSKLLI